MLGMGMGMGCMGSTGGASLAAQLAALYAAGEPGTALPDLANFSNLWQDTAGAIPVTAVGQSVGKALDASGNGHHFTFSNVTLQQDVGGKYCLAFNGSTSWGSTSAINFTGTDKMSVFAGVRKLSDAATGIIAELSANSVTSNGSFALLAPGAPGVSSIQTYLRGDVARIVAGPTNVPAPFSYVQTSVMNIAASIGAELTQRINGAITTSAIDAGAGNFGNYPLYIGARSGASFFFVGNLYSLIVRGAASSAAEIAAIEAYTNSKTGAY